MTHMTNDVMIAATGMTENAEQAIEAMLLGAAMLISDDPLADDARTLTTPLKEAMQAAMNEHSWSIRKRENRSNRDDS